MLKSLSDLLDSQTEDIPLAGHNILVMPSSNNIHEMGVDAIHPMEPHPLSKADDYPSHIRFDPPNIILTPRLYLRRATEDDIPAIHNFLTEETTMKYMSSKPSTSLADSEHWYKSRFGVDPVTGRPGDGFTYLICLRDGDREGKAIGTCGSRQAPHVGYQIGAGPEYWNKGYGSEAVNAMIDGICRTIRDEKAKDWDRAYLRIEVVESNFGSIRVAEKVGAKRIDKETRHERPRPGSGEGCC